REYAQTIESSSYAFLNVINDILDFSKLTAGDVDVQKSTFNLESLTRKVLAELRQRADEKNLLITTNIHKNIPLLLQGDSQRLHQILINLIGNSIKFTLEGKIDININLLRESDKTVDLHFSIRDTGIGISARNMKYLFKSFSQVDPSLTRKYGGTGLGLVISKQLVELMDGKIGVESEENKGSTFWFSLRLKKQIDRRKKESSLLPASRIQSRKEDKINTFDEQQNQNIKILLVENDKVNQVVATQALKQLGYHVEIANNGKKAVTVLKNKVFDVVLMDIQMPEMNGIDATKKIRDLKTRVLNPSIPIIAMTAHTLDGDRGKCFDAGMNEYLPKPIAGNQLRLVIQRCLSMAPQAIQRNRTKHQQDLNCIDNSLFNQLKKNVGDIESLIELFLSELPDKINAIHSAVSSDNPDNLKNYAHILKSNCITFGATRMADICGELETAGNSGKMEGAGDLIDDLKSEGEKVSVTLRNIL
ncbi:response regulator, partial [bacterium]|nr:response regulator [bacterium]